MGPRIAYGSCASVAAWNYVCNGSFFSSRMKTPWETETLHIGKATWTEIGQLLRCPPCTPCTTMALITWFASPRLRWSSLIPEPCSVEMERHSANGRMEAHGLSPGKFGLETERRKQLNCTDVYLRARSLPGNLSLATTAHLTGTVSGPD